MLTIFAVIAVLLLGTGGTVLASDGAKPGDLLFGIDRAVEEIRINLAGDDQKNDLRITFAEERVRELEEIIADEQVIAAGTISEIEVDVFTNETVVKIEAGDRKLVFTTDAKTQEAVVAEIMAKFDLTQADVEAHLSFEVEDRASRAEDKDSDDDSGERSERVASGIETVISFLEDVSQQIALSDDADSVARIQALIDQLNDELGDLSEDIKIDLRGDDQLRVRFESDGDDDEDSRLEIKTDDGKLKIEVKDGELRIKSNLFDDDEDEDAEDGDDDVEDNDNDVDDDSDEDEDNSGSSDDSDDDEDDDSDDDNSGSSDDDDDEDSDDDDNSGSSGSDD